ncbi:MAG TPA: tetratricopeptide repeat protein [Candidatus Nitrosocosmicus sp.]|jgi:tetratricopeptide (TPR) repeat protein|nr:tetratricopeptide repeat protein [Candidatus Nitrosocosmicus sp.]
MEKIFGRKLLSEKKDDDSSRTPSGYKITQDDIKKVNLYNKGVNKMAEEKFEDAIRCFDLSLRIDPFFVDALIKKGYSHFHLKQYNLAITIFDKVLEIDINNPEVWNMKGLVFYKSKNYEKAIECCEKAIDFNPNNAMAWYNYACYMTLDGRATNGMEALKKSIELDIANAKKAVKDRDFINARMEEDYKRIIEVVILESVRQGNDHLGKILWVTGLDREEIQDATTRLANKGLLIKNVKKTFTGKDEQYELTKELISKIGVEKRNPRSKPLEGKKEVLFSTQQLKDISAILYEASEASERGDLNSLVQNIDKLLNPILHGTLILDNFFEEHRELRLFNSRLRERGQEYLNLNKEEISKFMLDLDKKIRG